MLVEEDVTIVYEVLNEIARQFNIFNFQVWEDPFSEEVQIFYPSVEEFRKELRLTSAENMGYVPEPIDKEIVISVRKYQYNIKVRKVSLSNSAIISVKASQLMQIILDLITKVYHKTSIYAKNNNSEKYGTPKS